MSFFKDLKEDIGSAMGDFGSDDNQMVDTLSDTGSDSFDAFNLSEEDALGVDEEMIGKMEAEDTLSFGGSEESTDVPLAEELTYVEPIFENAEDVSATGAITENNLYTGDIGADTVTVENSVITSNELVEAPTVISKGTVINGSIVSDGALEVFGTVNGDISCLGKLSISGVVKGKSSAAEVYLHTNKLDGGITSKGCVKIAAGTVVIGDIVAASCVVAGAVKGNLDVNGPVVVDSTAVIKGNISSKGIQINSGAVIDGFCALPYASVDIDSFFEDEVEA
ncbi:MAG: bactofilin family protein [Catonella sp.]|uniref:bactofilin family protein n=1 Tax=Catonella sp. TaxID=2382125 RepID=UPI003FA0F6AD